MLKPWNFEIGRVYTPDTGDYFKSGLFIFIFKSWFTSAPLPTLGEWRRAAKEMAGKEVEVSQGGVNEHK